MKTAHAHLISALWTAIASEQRGNAGRPLRILDVGCGYGGLMSDILHWARELPQPIEIECYGYEVFDHRGQTHGFFDKLVGRLTAADPSQNWSEQVRIGNAGSKWPFADDFFHIIVSNQVLEHVNDIDHFFKEAQRVARPSGLGIHFFPANEIIVEPHSGVPLAHHVAPGSRRKAWLRLASRLGLGKFRRYQREQKRDIEAFSDEFSAYLQRYVFFRSSAELLARAKASTAISGYVFERELIMRAAGDDWDPYPYRKPKTLATRARVAPFAPCTLWQCF